MKHADKNEPLIFIVGPTAVGKTDLSIRLAEKLQGEILSADSRLFYLGMDIGTAKPTPGEMGRVPHHLIDVSPPDQVWSLALYLREARKIIHDIHLRGKLPFVVGGTGQYIRALKEGWRIPAVKPHPELRETLQNWAEHIGPEELRSRLEVLDPAAAADIDGPNTRRMIRALEVILTSGERFSEQRGKAPPPYRILTIGLDRPREELYQRIDQRIHHMIRDGFVREVKNLLEKGYDPDLPPLSAIGYRQIIHYLNGVIPLDEAVRQMQSRTRKFVRQQANWFSLDDPEIDWFQAGEDPFPKIVLLIEDFLKNI